MTEDEARGLVDGLTDAEVDALYDALLDLIRSRPQTVPLHDERGGAGAT